MADVLYRPIKDITRNEIVWNPQIVTRRHKSDKYKNELQKSITSWNEIKIASVALCLIRQRNWVNSL